MSVAQLAYDPSQGQLERPILRATNQTTMNEYTFWNPTTGEEIDIDAYGFEEASYLLYADDELDHNEWELHSVNRMM